MISYHFNESEGILYMKVEGIMTLEEMLTRSDKYKEYSEVIKDLKIFEDARNAKPGFDRCGLMKINGKLKEVLKDFNSIRHAVLHSDPTATAFALMNHQVTHSEKYTMMVFASETSAKEWLLKF